MNSTADIDSPVLATVQPARSRSRLARWVWFVVRNLVGWVLIVIAVPIGVSVPIPLPIGFALFIVGLAMVWLPGKRPMVARVLAGIPITRDSIRASLFRMFMALGIPAAVMLAMERWKLPTPLQPLVAASWQRCLLAMALALGAWVGCNGFMILASRILGFVPRLRRRFRPKLRRRGIRGGPRPRLQRPIRPRPAMNEPQAAQSTLLIRPPDSGHNGDSPVQGPIPVDFSGPLVTRSSLAAWLKSRTVQRLVGGLVTIAIFIWILRPIVLRWHMVGNRILATSPLRFILAAVMFATFLFVIRVISWRLIISGFGTCLPRGAAARIWSTSELARYVPGVIWQVVGRVYLVRPYGVDAITCSTSQILELTIFLVANILLALVCLPAFAGSTLFAGASPQDQAYARDALITTAVLSPLLLLLLKPSIFYGVVNGVLRLIGKRPIATRIGGKTLLVLMLLALTGLIWQGLAIWVLIGQPKALNIPIDRIGLIIGAYSLAWSFGFLAFWAPGGLGVRELILVTTLRYALPDSVAKSLGDADSVKAFLAFVAVLLRLWTIAGEFILTSIAYAIDHRGALGRPDAPGRIENARTAAYPPKDGAPN